jgi:hypothetical protein
LLAVLAILLHLRTTVQLLRPELQVQSHLAKQRVSQLLRPELQVQSHLAKQRVSQLLRPELQVQSHLAEQRVSQLLAVLLHSVLQHRQVPVTQSQTTGNVVQRTEGYTVPMDIAAQNMAGAAKAMITVLMVVYGGMVNVVHHLRPLVM